MHRIWYCKFNCIFQVHKKIFFYKLFRPALKQFDECRDRELQDLFNTEHSDTFLVYNEQDDWQWINIRSANTSVILEQEKTCLPSRIPKHPQVPHHIIFWMICCVVRSHALVTCVENIWRAWYYSLWWSVYMLAVIVDKSMKKHFHTVGSHLLSLMHPTT